MKEYPPGGSRLVAAATLIGLLSTYVAGYYALVKPVEASVSMTCFIPSGEFVATYPRPLLRAFFSPIHTLDRYIRPKLWRNEASVFEVEVAEESSEEDDATETPQPDAGSDSKMDRPFSELPMPAEK